MNQDWRYILEAAIEWLTVTALAIAVVIAISVSFLVFTGGYIKITVESPYLERLDRTH